MNLDKIVIYLISIFLPMGVFNPFNPTAILYGQEEGGVTPIQVLSVCFIGLALLNTKNYIYIKRYWKSIIGLIVILFLLLFSGVLYGDTFYSQKAVFNYKFLVAIIFYFLLAIVLSRKPREGLISMLLFATVSFIIALFYSLGFLELFTVVNKGRVWLFGENPNSTSARMVIATIILIYMVLENPFKWRRWRYWILGGTIPLVLLVFASGSRGSLLGLVIGSALLLVYSKINFKVKLFSSLSVLLLMFYLFTSSLVKDSGFSMLDRLIETVEEGNTGHRGVLWKEVSEIIIDNFILGVGENGYVEEMHRRYGYYLDPHNMYLYVFVCGGFFAMLALVVFFIKIFGDTFNLLKHRTAFPFALFFMVVFIALKTGGVLTYIIMWYFLAIVKSYTISYKEKKFDIYGSGKK